MMFQIDNQSRYAVYEQIVQQTERFILTRLLPPGEQLPSVRSLSLDLHVNPNTVQRAYTELDRKKLIYTISGIGCFVSEDAQELLQAERRTQMMTMKPLIQEIAYSGIQKEEILTFIEEIYDQIMRERHD